MLNGKSIVVIIPALNEAESISRVIADVPTVVDRIIVVDNGSTDGTARVAVTSGAEVVSEPRVGYGSACLAGIVAAGKPDLIAFVDADYSDYPEQLEMLITPVARDVVDLVIGTRLQHCERSSMAWHQRFGNRLACSLIRLVHGYRYSDLGPMRCIRRDTLEQFRMSDTDCGWTAEMQVKAARAGVRIREIPVRYRQRLGRSKISGTVRGTVRAAWKILFWSMRPLPPATVTGR